MATETLMRGAKDIPGDVTSDKGNVLLLAAEVATQLRVTEKALEHWRRRGTGPLFIRLGRNCVRYRGEDVTAFLRIKMLENG